MNKKNDLLGIILALVTGVVMLGFIIIRAFFPRMILPQTDGIFCIILSLIALVIDSYVAKAERNYLLVALYGTLVFGFFPLVSFVVLPADALRLAVMGSILFVITTILFDSVTDRLSSGITTKAAPLISAFGLFLAIQCFVGII